MEEAWKPNCNCSEAENKFAQLTVHNHDVDPDSGVVQHGSKNAGGVRDEISTTTTGCAAWGELSQT